MKNIKWTKEEKTAFLRVVEEHQCDTFEEELEGAWESLYVAPDEPNDFPKRSLSACKSAFYKIIKEQKAERATYLDRLSRGEEK